MQLGWWKCITLSPAKGEDACLERMKESGNKRCSNWKRRITAWWSISRLVRKWLVKWLVYMFLNCIMLLNGISFSSESVERNFQCKSILWSIDAGPIIHAQAWTACGHCKNCFFWYCWHIVPPLRFCLFWRYCTFDKVVLFNSRTR